MKITYYSHGNRSENKIALTFDDGPNPFFTEKILKILKNYNIKATFFIMGKWAVLYPQIVKKILAEGHLIGNHSYSHSQGDFKKADTFIKEIIDESQNFIRAPYLNLNFFRYLDREYLERVKIINFDVDSLDWTGASPKKIISRVKKLIRNGSIVDFHDGSERKEELKDRPFQMVEALPIVINVLKRKYNLVRVDKLSLIPEINFKIKSRQNLGIKRFNNF